MNSKWLHFEEVGTSASGKTKVWEVESSHSAIPLGEVRWFGRFRQYSFYPDPDTMYEPKCLRDLADFCAEQTRTHLSRAKS